MPKQIKSGGKSLKRQIGKKSSSSQKTTSVKTTSTVGKTESPRLERLIDLMTDLPEILELTVDQFNRLWTMLDNFEVSGTLKDKDMFTMKAFLTFMAKQCMFSIKSPYNEELIEMFPDIVWGAMRYHFQHESYKKLAKFITNISDNLSKYDDSLHGPIMETPIGTAIQKLQDREQIGGMAKIFDVLSAYVTDKYLKIFTWDHSYGKNIPMYYPDSGKNGRKYLESFYPDTETILKDIKKTLTYWEFDRTDVEEWNKWLKKHDYHIVIGDYEDQDFELIHITNADWHPGEITPEDRMAF